MPPTTDMTLAPAIRVIAAGGFDAFEMHNSVTPTADCTDDGETPCVPADREQPWLLYDMGQEFNDIYAVEIMFMPPAPPSPPYGPPPGSPPVPSTPPPPPPPSPKPEPPPPSPLSLPPLDCSANQDSCMVHNVEMYNNGICEDGLPSLTGLVNSEVTYCALGSDMTDCGYRPCTSGRRLEETYGGMFGNGHIEVYVSRQLALFGTRCATLNTTSTVDNRVLLRCMEGKDNADGRFVYIRSFQSARMLRIDGLRVYRVPGARRLEEKPVLKEFDEQILAEQKPVGTDEEAKEEHKNLHSSRMEKLGKNMLNLTKTVCNNRVKDAAYALQVRREAALLWAELDEETANVSCHDCTTLRNGNCTTWFTQNFGLHKDAGPHASRSRQLKESLREQEPERRRKLEEGLGKACCRINKLTGEKDCKKEYCHKAIQQKAYARMGHVLRRMHEKGHIDMSVDQKVAVDVMSPHLHSDPRCQALDAHSKRVDPKVTEIECLASSMVTHIADKHGIAKEAVDGELAKYGLSVAKMIAQPLKVATSAAETMSNFKSNPVFADMAAKLREKKRLADEAAGRRSLRQTSKPRGRALMSAREDVKQTKEAQGGGTGLAPSKKQNHKTRTRHVRNEVHGWLHNASKFASKVHTTAALSRASSLMPQVHAPLAQSMMDSSKDTIAAIVSSDGSVIGQAARSARALGDMVTRGNELAEKVTRAAEEAERAEKTKPRRLSEETVMSFYDQVDARLKANLAKDKKWQGRRLEVDEFGITLPEEHVRTNGWIAGAVEWKQLVQDTHAVANTLVSRRDDMLAHMDETGHLPTGPLERRHLTGVSLLDINAPPSRLGNMFRELHAWVTNKHKSTEVRQHHTRRLEESRATPRRTEENTHKSLLAALTESLVVGEDPLKAAWSVLENSNHHRTSHARKLADTFLGTAATVPLMFEDTSNKYASYQKTDGGVNFFRELTRYIVYGALCYYSNPNPDPSHTLLAATANTSLSARSRPSG